MIALGKMLKVIIPSGDNFLITLCDGPQVHVLRDAKPINQAFTLMLIPLVVACKVRLIRTNKLDTTLFHQVRNS